MDSDISTGSSLQVNTIDVVHEFHRRGTSRVWTVLTSLSIRAETYLEVSSFKDTLNAAPETPAFRETKTAREVPKHAS